MIANRLLDCVESIWIRQGKVQHLDYHRLRYERTMEMYYGLPSIVDIRRYIDTKAVDHRDVKCRLIYNQYGIRAEYKAYNQPKIGAVKLVIDDNVSYTFKTVERCDLDALYEQRVGCDEILICKGGLITDAYYYNVVLGNRRGLYTPKSPLLCGTQRHYLLDNQKVREMDIRIEMLGDFDDLYLVNALNPLGYIKLPISSVVL
jgi:4-amino-4-deoxychorismate lyase